MPREIPQLFTEVHKRSRVGKAIDYVFDRAVFLTGTFTTLLLGSNLIDAVRPDTVTNPTVLTLGNLLIYSFLGTIAALGATVASKVKDGTILNHHPRKIRQ